MGADAPQTTWQVAEAVLLDPHERGKLVAYASSRFGIHAEDAEDLVQDTAVELLRQQSYVQSPRGFVFAVFRARCARFLRTYREEKETLHREASVGEATPHPIGPEKLDRRVALQQALGEISSTCRKVLAAYYIEGQSLNEAARAITAASSGVYKTINRCLKRLRECLN